ncbi:hypothetical protein DsansV1_C06g0062851 [Dioscorea sansibarensis]
MAEWRRGLSRRSSGGYTRPPKNSRPPPQLGFWNPDVPSWEKQFFVYECPVTWEQLSYVKQSMSLYKTVQNWDDSAGLEAFQNAKFRYWANINNCQSDIPLPDPDMYIDEVDYDVVIDPEIVADLYIEPQQPTLVESSFDYMNVPIKATGWVHTEVPLPTSGLTAEHLSRIGIINTAWDAAKNDSGQDVKSFNAWNATSREVTDDYSSKRNTGDCWGDANVNNSRWQNERTIEFEPHGNSNNDMGKYGRNRDGGGWFGSRKTASKFKTDYNPTNRGWRNFRGKQNRIESIDASERTVYAGRPTSQLRKSTPLADR